MLGADLKKTLIEDLARPGFIQIAVVVCGYAAYQKVLEKADPAFLAGQSLGEYTALICSGALRLEEGLEIVLARSKWMAEASGEEGAMAAVTGVDASIIENICDLIEAERGSAICVSNYNHDMQTVISGQKTAIAIAAEKLKRYNAAVSVLDIGVASHSSLMAPAAQKLKAKLESLEYLELQVPVVSNVTGLPYSSHKVMREMLTAHLTKPVQWHRALKYLAKSGVATAVDVGPGRTQMNIAAKTGLFESCLSLDDY